MNDTTPTIEAELRALYHARSPAARLRMATAMFSSAKRLAIAGLLFGEPGQSTVALRRGLLDRLYGDALTAAQRIEIAAGVAAE